MTRTLPYRRMIRQCSQIRRIEDFTFMDVLFPGFAPDTHGRGGPCYSL